MEALLVAGVFSMIWIAIEVWRYADQPDQFDWRINPSGHPFSTWRLISDE
jgi:hypothetical protein